MHRIRTSPRQLSPPLDHAVLAALEEEHVAETGEQTGVEHGEAEEVGEGEEDGAGHRLRLHRSQTNSRHPSASR